MILDNQLSTVIIIKKKFKCLTYHYLRFLGENAKQTFCAKYLIQIKRNHDSGRISKFRMTAFNK